MRQKVLYYKKKSKKDFLKSNNIKFNIHETLLKRKTIHEINKKNL